MSTVVFCCCFFFFPCTALCWCFRGSPLASVLRWLVDNPASFSRNLTLQSMPELISFFRAFRNDFPEKFCRRTFKKKIERERERERERYKKKIKRSKWTEIVFARESYTNTDRERQTPSTRIHYENQSCPSNMNQKMGTITLAVNNADLYMFSVHIQKSIHKCIVA